MDERQLTEKLESESSSGFAVGFDQLTYILDKLIENYELLLTLVRKEKDSLISANIETLQAITQQKELMLHHVRGLDQQRDQVASELARQQKCEPKLLLLAQQFSGERKEKLLAQHRSLEFLITLIQDLNRVNETYAKSALRGLTGALKEIKETLLGKKTYEKRGNYKQSSGEASGSFVSKEA